MLDNVKMLLGVQTGDTSKDVIINYWIAYYTRLVLKYCHIDALNEDLQGIVEQMAVERLGGFGAFSNTSQNAQKPDGVKKITRGDYTIEYKDTLAERQAGAVLDKVATGYQSQLNLWRRLDY